MALKKTDRFEKMGRTLRSRFLDAIQNTPLQFRAYACYWHYQLRKNANKQNTEPAAIQFMAARPNYGAGIGHQLANWNTGYYFSAYYQLRFAHFPFSNKKWEQLLGFGEKEVAAEDLLKDKGIKKVRLPQFNSENKNEVALIGNIIASYKNKHVLFLLAQDQGYMEQCSTYETLSAKFFQAAARREDRFFYDATEFNIAIHIRRGDIVSMKNNNSSNWAQRWLNNDYYVKVLTKALAALPCDQKTAIYIFSQGTEQDFPEFAAFDNVHYCLSVNAFDSFLHLACADLLISSKSSFSYKPALISKGIKIYPASFWHAYPLAPGFIPADDNGDFDSRQLVKGFGRQAAL